MVRAVLVRARDCLRSARLLVSTGDGSRTTRLETASHATSVQTSAAAAASCSSSCRCACALRAFLLALDLRGMHPSAVEATAPPAEHCGSSSGCACGTGADCCSSSSPSFPTGDTSFEEKHSAHIRDNTSSSIKSSSSSVVFCWRVCRCCWLMRRFTHLVAYHPKAPHANSAKCIGSSRRNCKNIWYIVAEVWYIAVDARKL
mmetsp:Transcript_88139/g.221868  ORF Transcript_88139/g.221868 Transcript_88139/m.221868 type:complete len:202 (-) Transcript_88139:36-641(-)